MNILFIHQNFPGQFKFLAQALVQHGHQVVAMTLQNITSALWQGVRLVPYTVQRGTTPGVHPWVSDFETKAVRAEGCFRAALEMKANGFVPDVIVAHHGWGESLFLKDVWPDARLGIYCEFYYHNTGADVGFDPEFPEKDPGNACRLRLKNLNNLMHFQVADAGISPTHWQASTFPIPFRDRITVVHDGIDTDMLRPNPSASLTLNNTIPLNKSHRIITFINRNLEPYRGYHIFMRALPRILKDNSQALVLIIGGSDIGYGAAPQEGTTWKDIFFNEVKDDLDVNRIFFLGRLSYEHYIAVMQLSTVHVYLTYPFVLSWSLLEAMSMGCCIVASDTQPLHEAIEHDKTGRLVDFFDVQNIANNVTQLLDNPAERQRLGENARKYAVENYDLQSVCLPRQLEWVAQLGDRRSGAE